MDEASGTFFISRLYPLRLHLREFVVFVCLLVAQFLEFVGAERLVQVLDVVSLYASWVGLLYSLWLSGMGYQTGLLPWLYWLRRRQLPRREFLQSGLFKWMRHPVYLSFLGLIWFTPRMTLDHVILTGVWTVYIYLGSYLKDQRLLHYIGEPYRHYMRRVPGFPLIGLGILGRSSTDSANCVMAKS